MKVVIITGTPGTGKTTIAELVAKKIPNSKVIHVSQLIKKKHLYTSKAADNALVVDMKKLKLGMNKVLKENKGKNLILEGHILCDIRVKGAVAVVLREHLETLIKRMQKRGYKTTKIRDNVVSEATDYCGINAAVNYDKVLEVFGSNSSLTDIVNFINGKKVHAKRIDLIEELGAILVKKKQFAI